MFLSVVEERLDEAPPGADEDDDGEEQQRLAERDHVIHHGPALSTNYDCDDGDNCDCMVAVGSCCCWGMHWLVVHNGD